LLGDSSSDVTIRFVLDSEGLSIFAAIVVIGCQSGLLASNGRVEILLEAATSAGDLKGNIFDVIGCQAD
jgi:hypothetical protein